MWGSYYNIPKAIFYLLKRDYTVFHAKDRRYITVGAQWRTPCRASVLSDLFVQRLDAQPFSELSEYGVVAFENGF